MVPLPGQRRSQVLAGTTPSGAHKDRHSRRAGASGGTWSKVGYRAVRALAVFEYGESPAALCARTRYVYVVREARPVSVYVVAVPATAAIWTKFVHREPVQRSMRTSV